MPKIIESVREQLLETARSQIERGGYAKTTIRSVAAECGVAVGTVYNYFPSKDMLIATFMWEDWRACLAQMEARRDGDAKALLKNAYDLLGEFMEKHRSLFRDPDAAKVYSSVFSRRHRQLRSQIAHLVAPLCAGAADEEYLSEFIAEALLTWTMEGAPFEKICAVMEKLI